MPEETLTKGERTRTAIEEAAFALFLERGFHATSMRQIAERAGLALGSIYNHFASKDEIFRALIHERHPYRQILPLLLAAPGERVEEFVHNAAHALVAELGRQPDFLKLMFIEIVEFDSRHVPELFQEIFPQALPLMQRLAAQQHRLRPVPPPVLLRAFLGMFFSFYITEILIGENMPAEMRERALDDFVDIFLHGILAQE